MGVRVRAVIEYDGSDYAGFQWQSDRPTIQGEIEAVLLRLSEEKIRIKGAGRTDAGVHAEGQVIAFDTAWRHPLGKLQRGMNALLPRCIAVQRLEQAAADFHPRFDALSRRYRYRILNQPVRSPLSDRFACHVSRGLDVAAMDQATQHLVGVHDFATFGLPTQGDVTIRNLLDLTWQQHGRLIEMEIEANAFLRYMVRSIVGTALAVGFGEITTEEFLEILESRERARSSPPAPPQGLCLTEVRYAGEPATYGAHGLNASKELEK